jgi:hypothetical protein
MKPVYAWSWHWPNRDIVLRVPVDVVAVWRQHRQALWQRERGGQLFAEVAASGDLVLVLATPPHPSDRSSWGWLELDAARCQAEVADANLVGHRLVGTWHTHPQRVPHLSPTDHKTLTASARINEGVLPASLAVIVGYGAGDVSIRAWRVDVHSVEEGLVRS